jgi:cytochrome oxidase assembly protein ShyY1
MYRFLARPKWVLFTLLMTALVVLMVNLAFWQLRRLDQRQSFNHEVSRRTHLAIAPLDTVLTASADPAAVEWTPVSVTGTYETTGQVLIRDRSLATQPGFNAVNALRLSDGRFLVVERGWIPETATAVPPSPTGTVTIQGWLRLSERRHHSWEKADPPSGVLDRMNRVDVARLDQQIPGDALPMYLQVNNSVPADPAVTPIPLPALSDGPHLSYAVQWFLFSVAAIVGWVLVVRKGANDRRKAAAKAERAAAAE